ncbi:hypothetical protein E4O00_06100 [Treponema sp. OMZ 788]|uniref:hypothetical protein n=1 Tax=Treponema sp. OMZ 788 TaxID=2563664 RepID=UPI0020A5894A|nr:hypothetical protein [Treponema sp. OMZ 788]UTC65649.1 hypothetical protein E4O00_06100 [Treponema sp. OMZ 788]
MKKYFFIFPMIIFILTSVNSQDVIDEQTETMLHEIRARNGIDYFEPKGETDYIEEQDNQNEDNQTNEEVVEEIAIEESPPSPPKEPFLKGGRKAFAFGIEAIAGASNSYFKIMDFFKESLEVDLNKISKGLPNSGFSLSPLAKAKIYFDIYINSKAEFGFFTTADVYGFANIPKSIMKFISEGNPSGQGFNGKITSSTFAFADTGIFYGMNLNNFKFRVSPSYFIPAAYVVSDLGDYEFINDPITGKILAKGSVNLKVYSHLPIFGNPNDKLNLKDIFSRGGVDVSFTGTYTFNQLANLNFGIKNIPIVPSELNKGIEKSYQGKFEIESIIKYLDNLIPGNEQNIIPPTTEFTQTELSYDLPAKKIFRPLKLAVSSDIRPFFNDYLIITPSLGCHCYKPFYVDAGVKVESRFLKVLGAYIGMSYEDRVWKNTAGLFLETRIFRLETAVSAASPSFTGSFKGTGAEATIKMVFGY